MECSIKMMFQCFIVSHLRLFEWRSYRLVLGNVAVDVPLSDTYFCCWSLPHGYGCRLYSHYRLYHWYPSVTGRMNDTLGKIHFWITFIGTCLIYFQCTTSDSWVFQEDITQMSSMLHSQSVADLNQFITIYADCRTG